MSRIIPPLIILLLFVASCKKDKDAEPTTIATPKVKTITTVDRTGTVLQTDTFYYDADGRQIFKNRSDGYIIATSYTAGKAIVTYYELPGITAGTQTIFLNADGLADSALSVFGLSISLSRYLYNSEGHIITHRLYNGSNVLGNIYTYAWEDGNLRGRYNISATYQNLDNLTYTYNTQHKNTIGNSNKGLPFLGADSENPYNAQAVLASGNQAYVYSYSYTYDSQGRISTQSEYGPTGELNYTDTYTYY